jgi:hypothetical protein
LPCDAGSGLGDLATSGITFSTVPTCDRVACRRQGESPGDKETSLPLARKES